MWLYVHPSCIQGQPPLSLCPADSGFETWKVKWGHVEAQSERESGTLGLRNASGLELKSLCPAPI